MDAVLAVAAFLIILTVLTAVHEAGHVFTARAFGVRVSEFFIGAPFGPHVSHTSKRSGITYGATLALLGGYTKIAGLAPFDDRRAALVLALVNARGTVTVDEVVRVLGCPEDEAYALLVNLESWGSVAESWPKGVVHGRNDLPTAYTTVARDAEGRTARDRGHDFSLPGATVAGEPFSPALSADAFFARERSRTYLGLGFPKRLVILLAGSACNLVFAIVLIALYFSMHGVPALGSEGVSAVAEGSAAAAAGMEEGDRIVSVGGVEVAGYDELGSALDTVRGTGSFELVYQRGDQTLSGVASISAEEMLGVEYLVVMQGLPVADALYVAVSYVASVGEVVATLLLPSETPQVLEGSSGVVGIAVLTQDAVASGLWSVILLAAMISVSLGWMNLLPIPPLDGGKALIELVQRLSGRSVSLRVQNTLSLVGMALFMMLFVYMVVQDVSRIAGV